MELRFLVNGRQINPVYDAGLTKEYQPQSEQAFFRASLNGKLKLKDADYDWIKSQPFQTEFVLTIEEMSAGAWVKYWEGVFYKTDCQWNDDSRSAEIKPQIKDPYSLVLAGMDKEYNLIKLAPARTLLEVIKRPLIQLYIPGDKVISCYMAGTYWEQDVKTEITDLNALKNKYYFAPASTAKTFSITGPAEHNEYIGDYNSKGVGLWIEKRGLYKITEHSHSVLIQVPNYPERNYYATLYYYKIIQIAGNVTLFTSSDYKKSISNDKGEKLTNDYIGFQKEGGGAGLSGFAFQMEVYMRFLLDVEIFMEKPTYVLPPDDFVSNNRNYKRAINYAFDLMSVSLETQEQPTEWGLADDGKYFKAPSREGAKYYPIARSTWGYSSKWLNFSGINPEFEKMGHKAYTLKDSSMLSDVIKVLLKQIDPALTHEATPEYSQFLYGDVNPISNTFFRLMLTQKSNVLAGEYDRPAQKAVISLNQVFKMLKSVYDVHWYIEDNKLKFEHKAFFRNGRSYTETPELNADLTRLLDPKIKKPYAFGTSQYTYKKEALPQQIEFSWMDEVTTGFKGLPIVINSRFTQAGKNDTETIEQFTSDIDYMLVNPEAFSPDGFALFAAIYDQPRSRYKLPFVQRGIDGAQLIMQNGYLSMVYIQPVFWVHDLPSYDVKINGEPCPVKGITRTKTHTVRYPSLTDPDPLKLVKTYLGNGQVNKISINLSSRQNEIELVYDTE